MDTNRGFANTVGKDFIKKETTRTIASLTLVKRHTSATFATKLFTRYVFHMRNTKYFYHTIL